MRKPNNERVVLLGSGGHAKSIIDSIENCSEYEIIGILDVPEKKSFRYKEYKIIGTDNDLESLFAEGITSAFVSIGFLGEGVLRESLYEKLTCIGFTLPIIIDKTAIIANDVELGEGTFIGKGVIINADVKVGKMCIINSGTILEHECEVGDFSHIAIGATICGEVKIGVRSFIGANSTVIQGIKIGNNVTIGAGCTVIENINSNSTYIEKRRKNNC